MKTYARIENDVVVELFETDGNITEMFHPDLIWLEVTGVQGIKEGWPAGPSGFEPPQPAEKTKEQLFAEFSGAIQSRLDAFAKTRNYDGILSACTYATSAVPKFKAEGQRAVSARDMTWASGYAILEAVEAGERPMPTIEEVMAELPALEWPQ